MPLSEWKEYKFNDLGEIKTGKTPPNKAGDIWGNSIQFITPTDISNQKYITQTNRGLSDLGLEKVKTCFLPKDSIIVTCIGSDMGKVVINKEDCITNQQINSIIIDKNKFSADYIYYNFSTRKDEFFNLASGGSTMPILNKTAFSNLKIKLPPLSEQQAIAEVLGSLDDKIELNRKINKTLEDMAQAIFKSWFVDFDPVKYKMSLRKRHSEFISESHDYETLKQVQGDVMGLSQEILDLFPDSFEPSELGDIPKGWSIYEFDDILEITSSKRIFMSDYVSEGIPFYRSKEIIEKQKGNNVSTELFITKQKYNEIKDKFSVPKVGDILLTSVGTLGVSYLVKNSDEFYFKDGNLTWFKNYTKTFPEIIYYWLRSSMGQSRLEEISIGSTQKALTIASMKKINIILPSVEIQKELNMTFKIIRDNIDFHNDQIETLSTMRDTLLPKLISGELRIPDAEKLVEGVV